MPRFYIPPHAWNPDKLALDDGETHHALGVLRMKAGEKSDGLQRAGGGGDGGAGGVRKGARGAAKDQRRRRARRCACEIVLGQAIPKGKNMELIVEKATELGAAAIVPLLSERTIVRADEEEALAKREKWQRVAVEAAKQCGQNWLPTVDAPVSPKEFFQSGEQVRPDADRVAPAGSRSRSRKRWRSWEAKAPERVLILVGPEGDFTPAEINLAKSRGLPADHAGADHPADGDGGDLLPERAGARAVPVGRRAVLVVILILIVIGAGAERLGGGSGPKRCALRLPIQINYE